MTRENSSLINLAGAVKTGCRYAQLGAGRSPAGRGHCGLRRHWRFGGDLAGGLAARTEQGVGSDS